MTASRELPVVHVNLPCRDEAEFQAQIAPQLGRDGIFVPTDTPMAVGARLLLRGHWIDGTVGVRGEAIVRAVAPPGQPPGMTAKLVRLDSQSVTFPLSDVPSAEPDLNRFGPWPDDESWEDDEPPTQPGLPASADLVAKAAVSSEPVPWMTAPTAPVESSFDVAVDFDAPDEPPTRVHLPAAELLRKAGAGTRGLAVAPPVLFGNYWLLLPLASGADVDAWVACSADTTQAQGLCVIKAARAQNAPSRVLEKAREVAGLSHPNLARLIEAGEVAGRPFVVIDHAYGRHLDVIVARMRQMQGAPALELGIAVGLGVCRALEFLHGQLSAAGAAAPIFHGDVRAENVFVGIGGEVRLERLDVSEAQRATAGPVEPTGAADLYATGGLIHGVLTLGLPLPAEASPSSNNPITRWHRPPSDWNQAIPQSVDNAVLGATHGDPRLRYPSIRDFRRALEEERRYSSWSLEAMMLEMFGPEIERERAVLAGQVAHQRG